MNQVRIEKVIHTKIPKFFCLFCYPINRYTVFVSRYEICVFKNEQRQVDRIPFKNWGLKFFRWVAAGNLSEK